MTDCTICKIGTVQPNNHTTLTFDKNNRLIIVRNVPAAVCNSCGEPYLDESTARRVMQFVDEARRRNVELEIISFTNGDLPEQITPSAYATT